MAQIPETLFWDLTPGEVAGIVREAVEERQAWEVLADRRAALVCATLANCHRGKDTRPFAVEDFMPKRAKHDPDNAELEAKLMAALGSTTKSDV